MASSRPRAGSPFIRYTSTCACSELLRRSGSLTTTPSNTAVLPTNGSSERSASTSKNHSTLNIKTAATPRSSKQTLVACGIYSQVNQLVRSQIFFPPHVGKHHVGAVLKPHRGNTSKLLLHPHLFY